MKRFKSLHNAACSNGSHQRASEGQSEGNTTGLCLQRPLAPPGSEPEELRLGPDDQASARGEVKVTPLRCSASQDIMMNMGSRGIIAAVLDNNSDSDTEALKGRNRH